MKRIYISGKITGLDINVARELFDIAAKQLKERGFIAINPMELIQVNNAWQWVDYMKADIKLLLDCDGICLLANWKDSKGAQLEHDIADRLGMGIIYPDALEVA